MRKIFKYTLEFGRSEAVISMHMGARILHVHEQNGAACLWAMVHTGFPLVQHRFRVFGTGHEIPDSVTYTHHIGTVHVDGFVWHIFDAGEVQ